MSILGTYVDKVANNTLTAFTITTYNHSLGTNPDFGLIVLRSMTSSTAPGLPAWVGANASLSTVLVASALGAGVVNFDLFSFYLHSMIR